VIFFAILEPMFRAGRILGRGGDASLVWQVLLIVPPVVVLAAFALYSLRQDRAAIEQNARGNASILAPGLAGRFGARVEADLATLIASSCSGPAAGPASPEAGEAALTPLCGLIVNGQIRVPLDYQSLPSPPDWVRQLAPAELKHWQILASATPATDTGALQRAAAALGTAPGPVRLNAEWALVRAEAQRGTAANAAARLFSLARRAEGVETESGTPLSDLAMLLAFRQLPAGSLTDVLLQDVERHVLERPSFLTGTLIDEATRLAPGGRVTARIRARFRANERALTLLRGLRVEDIGHVSAVWLDSGDDTWTAFVHPIATTGAAIAGVTRSASQVTLVPLQALERVFQTAPEGRDVPDYATLTVVLGGRSFRAGRPLSPAAVPLELASGPGQFVLPLTVPADTVREFAGELLRIAPDAMPLEQRSSGGVVRLAGVPGAHAFTLKLELADADALYASYRLRLWMAAGLILAATLAALGGLAGAWRAFERQRRLGEMKSNFVASVSHELRAPIGAMRLMTESLERGTVADAGRQQEYFRIIGQECRRLSSLVENVLDFSRIDRGSREYAFESTDLDALVARTVEVMRPCACERQVNLVLATFAADRPAGRRRIDGAAIQQALTNLVDNAIKHSPAGATVCVELQADAASARIFVEDDGPGIPEEEQERIFEPFYRLGSELRRETQGVGIGLSIAKHIAEAHGGRITVESSPGTGSQFTIVLPAAEEPAS
jgi:signal transduction histidine kinase